MIAVIVPAAAAKPLCSRAKRPAHPSLPRQQAPTDEDALRRGIRSIPTVIIAGRPIEGAVPYEEYARAVDQAG